MAKSNKPVRRREAGTGKFTRISGSEPLEQGGVAVEEPPIGAPSAVGSDIFRKETHSDEFPMGEKPPLRDPVNLDEPVEREPELILPVDKPLQKKQAEALAFSEEPITIRIERGPEKFAAPWAPCTVNGKAHVLIGGRWMQTTHFPVNKIFTTKRKYVEVLARSRTDNVSTEVIGRETDRPENVTYRSPSMRFPFTIIEDKNPMGREWLAQIMGMPT